LFGDLERKKGKGDVGIHGLIVVIATSPGRRGASVGDCRTARAEGGRKREGEGTTATVVNCRKAIGKRKKGSRGGSPQNGKEKGGKGRRDGLIGLSLKKPKNENSFYFSVFSSANWEEGGREKKKERKREWIDDIVRWSLRLLVSCSARERKEKELKGLSRLSW